MEVHKPSVHLTSATLTNSPLLTDYSLHKLWCLLRQPPCFVIDFRPFIPPVIVVADVQVAEEISRPSQTFPYALGKDQGLSRFQWVLGKESIVLTEVGRYLQCGLEL